jgi:hypothetical protein
MQPLPLNHLKTLSQRSYFVHSSANLLGDSEIREVVPELGGDREEQKKPESTEEIDPRSMNIDPNVITHDSPSKKVRAPVLQPPSKWKDLDKLLTLL